MHKPLEDLKHDHRLIERVLAVLGEAGGRLERGEEVSPDLLDQALTFVRGFADGCHHAKEERGLFPALAQKGPMLEAGPIRVMLMEHELGRSLIADLAGATEQMREGKAEGRLAARSAIEGYAGLLRDHIAKEEDVLFLMAQNLLGADDVEGLAEQFERVEREAGADAHQRFEALVREMEQALGLCALP
ncbi:MAG: hypothetical protein A2148_00570 [Chloroflexi bacterium RBG_16_68_14]|nr:MAG: hypothetical protein A2148_00570 [Chloroflexi bacterium RBG_16_68_14]